VRSNSPRANPERENLAAVVSEIAEMEADLAKTRDAAETAANNRREAAQLAERLRAELEGAYNDPQRLVASITAGEGVETLIASEAASDKQASIAARDAELWARAERACQERIKPLEETLNHKHWRVVDAAKAVVRSEADVDSLLDGLEAMQVEVTNRRCALHCLAREGLLREEDKARVLKVVRANWTLPGIPEAGDWCWHPVYLQWVTALRALEQDPNAPLPCERKA
jgi:hypothetical protein